MRIWMVLILCFAAVVSGRAAADAYTLTFDDASLLQYRTLYGVQFSPGFFVTPWSPTTNGFGHPHSGTKVLAWHDYSGDIARVDVWSYYVHQYGGFVSLGAYFSTAQCAQVRLTGYAEDGSSVGSVLIGAAGDEWDDRYAELAPTSGVASYFLFEGVNSSNDLQSFFLDDMTIVPVPEPSTLSFLSLALAGVGVRRLRRRR